MAKPDRDATKAFISDLSAGNIDSALARCTDNLSRDDVEALSTKAKAFGTLQDTTIFAMQVNNNNGQTLASAGGVAKFSGGQPHGFQATLKVVNGQHKIDTFQFQ
jgi:hypothetical protein